MAAGPGLSANFDDPYATQYVFAQDTLPPLQDRFGDYLNDRPSNPFDLSDPSAIQQNVEYDPESGLYLISEKIGEGYYRAPTYMTFDEYLKWRDEQSQKELFNRLRDASSANSDLKANDPLVGIDVNNRLLDRLFCGSAVDIRPNGAIDLTFGGDFQRVDNPILTERQRRQGGFDFDMNIQMNVIGKIGEKLKLSTNYNTQASFDFENQVKLEYTSDPCDPDAIIKRIEAGNVSFPLRSQLIQGSQTLFGVKTELQFGRMTLTGVMSSQRSKREEIQIQGGTQLKRFAIPADRYDENRHFFLSHYNRGQYEPALQNLPQINSLFRITKMEVWVTNTRNATQDVRDIVAISDLGAADPTKVTSSFATSGFAPSTIPVNTDLTGQGLPSNDANGLYASLSNDGLTRAIENAVNRLQTVYNLQQVQDFEKVSARKLNPNEFSYHPELGYVSLNLTMQPEDILGLAYEYTYNGERYQVGEFSQDVPISPDTLNVLYVKMLKSSTPRIDLPIWDLMMKNVYSLGAFQVNQEDFKLDVFYQDPEGGELRFLPQGDNVAGRPLISLLNLDNLNSVNDPRPDGVFDFVPSVTILPQNGRLIFPVLEPFGSSLYNQFNTADPAQVNIASQYVYQQLYDSTITKAREFPEFNRYLIKGTYRSSVSSEISLGAFNIPRGSVTVTAGGQQLIEGRDYDVDYNIGRIKILNESILNSGLPIRVSFEDNTLFGFQTKTLMGLRADYKFNEKLNIGGTVMRLNERPFTQKVDIGQDPIRNTVYGLDVTYNSDAPWLTKAVDKIPLIQTKEPSNISFMAEGAYLKPGTSKAISLEDESTVYLDDFEGSVSNFDLRSPATNWFLASTPQVNLFPEAQLVNDTLYGINRARLTWYQIDHGSLRSEADGSPYEQEVIETDVFPNVQLQTGQTSLLRTLDLTYYPQERGPYNFDVAGTVYSSGVGNSGSAKGKLLNPQSRWGGIMRAIDNNDFEAANIEYIEFWLLDPFIGTNAAGNPQGGTGGNLYFNLGNVSEDILRDSRNFFENGLPAPGADTRTDTTAWGRVPRTQAITNAFDNDPAVRDRQDVGLDGLDDDGERGLFSGYLSDLLTHFAGGVNDPDYVAANDDPAGDNFLYYNDDTEFSTGTSVRDRYIAFNNPQNNSQAPQGNQVTASTNLPDTEDLNRDNTLNETESFFEYRVPLVRDATGSGIADNQYVVDQRTTAGGETWYQYRVPIEEFTDRVGGIQDFRSIRFLRMYLHGFDDEVTLRFARLQLVRNQWRRYSRSLRDAFVGGPPPVDQSQFDLSAVSIERNGERLPFSYVLPPGIDREEAIGQFEPTLQNEQSLAMNVCELNDGDAKGAFKILNVDLRQYKRLKMFVHGESVDDLNPGDLTVFVRVGSDFENNYYEYEIPLTMSDQSFIGGSTTDEAYIRNVWPEENEIDFPFELLTNLKVQRNQSGSSFSIPYSIQDPDNTNNRVTIRGNPNLGLVEGIMIGIRNPKDDGLTHCAEAWFNELRLSGFDERGGIAGLARLDAQLADFGNLTFSTSYSSIGWGTLEQKLQERSREEIIQYDAAGAFELGMFLPKKSGIKIPFYAQISETRKNPEFDPYDLDIRLKDKVSAEPDPTVKKQIREQAQDFTSIKSVNFTNVRKERTNKTKKPRPWDIENVSLTYAYSNTLKRDPTIESNEIKEHRGVIDYGYNSKPTYVEPFKKIKAKTRWLDLVRDFNFNPIPNGLSFSTGMGRQFGVTKFRFADPLYSTYFDKRFTWDRNYGLKWNLTKSLNVSFNATNLAVIDEPDGFIDTDIKKDSIWTNVRDWGRTKNYSHNLSASYTLPLKKIPALDWIQVKAQYGADYNWNAAALNADSLGNIISNGQTRQATADINFVTLYNKSKYLKKLNTPPRPKGKKKKDDKKKGGKNAVTPARPEAKPEKGKKKEREITVAERIILRPLMMLRKARFSYNESYGTVVPGFTPQTRMLGMDPNFEAPGWDFVFGLQPNEARIDQYGANGWITNNVFLNQQLLQTYSQTLDARVTAEPFRDFRIDITAERNYVENHSEYYKVADPTIGFEHLAKMDVGSFSVSYFSLNTMFKGTISDSSDVTNVFSTFERNREIISNRVSQNNLGTIITDPDDPAYADGFGRYSQDVLIPAFVAAYGGRDANKVKLDIFKTRPLPNWKVSYNGLAKLEAFKKIFASFNISHGYSSKLTLNSYRTDLEYDPNNPFSSRNDITDDYFSEFEVPDVVISEQLQPLIGLDMRFKNDISARVDFKKSRQLAMSFIDYRLNETNTTEYTVGMGYRIKGLPLPFAVGKKKIKKLENDVNFQFDFSFRDDLTVSHLLDQGYSVRTRGLKTIRISPSIDYTVNKRLNLRLFFDRTRTIPAVSSSFPITNTAAGLNVRFSLQ